MTRECQSAAPCHELLHSGGFPTHIWKSREQTIPQRRHRLARSLKVAVHNPLAQAISGQAAGVGCRHTLCLLVCRLLLFHLLVFLLAWLSWVFLFDLIFGLWVVLLLLLLPPLLLLQLFLLRLLLLPLPLSSPCLLGAALASGRPSCPNTHKRALPSPLQGKPGSPEKSGSSL